MSNMSIRCPICGQRFETQSDLDAHVPCPESGDERSSAMSKPLGFAIGRGSYRPNPTVIGEVSLTSSGNTAIRIGTVLPVGTVIGDAQTEHRVVSPNDADWEQTGYVVLTPDERRRLISELIWQEPSMQAAMDQVCRGETPSLSLPDEARP